MGFFSMLKDIFTPEEPRVINGEDPNASQVFSAQEVSFNPTPTGSYERQLGRLRNLYNVRVKSPEVLAEIERYRDSIEGLGYTAPRDAAEANTYLDLLKG